MRGCKNTKSSSFSFGAPFHKYTRSSENIGDYGASFYEVLCSWLSFRDFRSVGSIAEVEKIRNVFSAMFQDNHKQMVKKHKKTKYKEVPHIVKIDLNKIDENLKLSNNEKRQLKRTLHQIKYREFGTKSNKRDIKRGNNKSVVLTKHKKSVIKDKNAGRNKKKQSTENSKERLKWQRSDCKHCALCSKLEDETHSKWNERSHVTNISSSEERIFKTLMNLDRSCCGESFKKLFDYKGRKTFLTQKHNINIENVELKYIQPTCLVQYEGLQRILSNNAALESHLGVKSCRSVTLPHSSRTKSMHYNDDMRNSPILFITDPPIMSKSTVAELLNKNNTSTEETLTLPIRQKIQTGNSSEFDTEKHIESLKMYCDNALKGYSEDSRTLLLSDSKIVSTEEALTFDNNQVNPIRTEDKYPSNHEIPPVVKKNNSRYQKFKNFAKKCFCICGSGNDSKTDLLIESRRDREVGSVRLKNRLKSPNVKVIRMTEEEFLVGKKERISG